MKTQLVGHSDREDVLREAKILNRVVRATEDGWEYECDQRQVEIILEQLDLVQASPLGTPGVEETTNSTGDGTAESKSSPISAEIASLYRAITARANYVAQDRADIQYAVKELCRRMSDPDEACMGRLKRLGRHLRASQELFPDSCGRRAHIPKTCFRTPIGRVAEPPGRVHPEGQYS